MSPAVKMKQTESPAPSPKPIPRKTLAAINILKRAFKLFGPHGERWIKGDTYVDGSYCSIGATRQAAIRDPNAYEFSYDEITGDVKSLYSKRKVVTPQALLLAERALAKAYGEEIIDFNDAHTTRFRNIRSGFKRAIKSLESGKFNPKKGS